MTRDEQPRSPCYDDRRFTSIKAEDVREALAICGGCTFRACVPVLRQIRESLTDRGQLEGVWDGKFYSPNSQRQQHKPIKHATVHGARVHRGRGEKPCDECQGAENAASAAKRAKKKTSQPIVNQTKKKAS